MTNQLYLIAFIPPNPLRDKIQQLKLEVKEKFNSSHSLNSPPHITLLNPFRIAENMEDKLESLLKDFAREFEPFKIQLNDFSTFPPRVVFIDVKKSESLNVIQQKLEQAARSKPDMFSYNYQQREYHPHITLAFKDLTKSNFYKAWDEFEGREFDEDFIADRFHLLKHNGEKWLPIKDFQLQK